jgi:hypothetical protein
MKAMLGMRGTLLTWHLLEKEAISKTEKTVYNSAVDIRLPNMEGGNC